MHRQKPRPRCAHHEWNRSFSQVTPQVCYLLRREFLRVFGVPVLYAAQNARSARPEGATPNHAAELNDSLNPTYKLDRVKLTPQHLVTSYNNFYEWAVVTDQPEDLANQAITGKGYRHIVRWLLLPVVGLQPARAAVRLGSRTVAGGADAG